MSRDPAPWRVAAVQMNSTVDRERNLGIAEFLARRAADAGATLVAFPEHFSSIRSEGKPAPHPEKLDGPLVAWTRNLAAELGCWILAGSFAERVPGSRRLRNTSLLFAPTGETVAAYRKMHLFDARIRGQAALQESKTVAPGDRPVVVKTLLGRLGFAICYDLRFPELFRHLALDGAQVVFVPSAFTDYTGRHHWMPLLRARAIENQCWIVAPAQVGSHDATRASHGHSAIVDPWGNVVALLEAGEGVVSAEIDLEHLRRIRSDLPCLDHVRPELLGRKRPAAHPPD